MRDSKRRVNEKIVSVIVLFALLISVMFAGFKPVGANANGVRILASSTNLTSSVPIRELSWTLGDRFPVINGRVMFPPQSPLEPAPSYHTHWFAGSIYPSSLAPQNASSISMIITVPASEPQPEEFYYVLLSAFDSNGSYDQIGFSACFGIWGLTYSWTSGSPYPGSAVYNYDPKAKILSPGATYTFNITTKAGTTYFVVYQGFQEVWSLDAPTGGDYLILSNYFASGVRGRAPYDYTDYEEVYNTSTPEGAPDFDLTFSNNTWTSTDGSLNAATWTPWYSQDPGFLIPGNVQMVISGDSVLVKNPGTWWPMFHHDSWHNGYSPTTAPGTNQTLWTFTAGGSMTTGGVTSSPTVAGGTIFVGSNDNRTYAMNAATGALVWNYPTGGAQGSSPAVADGVVYVGSEDGKIYAFGLPLTVSVWPTSVTMDVGQSYLFTSNVSGGMSPYSYQWYLKGTAARGATSSAWVFTPTSSGSCTVYLNVTASSHTSAKSNIASTTVNPEPSVSVSPTSLTLDVGQPKAFSATASGGSGTYSSYQWYVGGAAQIGQTSSTFNFSPGSSGSFSITVTVTDGLGVTSAQSSPASVTVNSAPSARVSPTSWTMDVGQSQSFVSTVSHGTPPYSYQWYLNATAVLSATSSYWTFTPASLGTYDAYVNVTDNAGLMAKSDIAVATVHSQLNVSITPASVTMDAGQSQFFTSNVSGGTSPYTYQWYLNGVLVLGATSAGYTFASSSAGVYNVSLVVQDAASYQLTPSPTRIAVNNSPLITNFRVTPLSSSRLYSNNKANASLSTSGGSGPYTYEWYLNGVNVENTTSPSYTYVFSKMGQQQIQVKVTDSTGYLIESSVLSTDYSYNYLPFVLLAVFIVALIGAVIFVLRRRVSKPSTPKT